MAKPGNTIEPESVAASYRRKAQTLRDLAEKTKGRGSHTELITQASKWERLAEATEIGSPVMGLADDDAMMTSREATGGIVKVERKVNEIGGLADDLDIMLRQVVEHLGLETPERFRTREYIEMIGHSAATFSPDSLSDDKLIEDIGSETRNPKFRESLERAKRLLGEDAYIAALSRGIAGGRRNDRLKR